MPAACVSCVHAYGTVGAANGTPGAKAPESGAQEPSSAFAYTARLGVNAIGFNGAYEDDRRVDFGLGYELEQMPFADPVGFAHGPYAELSLWPNLRPFISNRVGLRAFGELMFTEDRGSHLSRIGPGGTLALAFEFAKTKHLEHTKWERQDRRSFGHGRGALGTFLSTSYRSVGDVPYWMLGAGISIRVPLSVSDVVTESEVDAEK